MEAIMLVGGIAFIAGLIIRSLFITQQQPQVIYVQTEPMERGGNGSGCFPIIVIGLVLLVLLLAVGGV